MTFFAFSRARTVTVGERCQWTWNPKLGGMVLTVARAGADFDDDIGGLEVCLVDNGVADAGVLEDVLAKVLVEAEDVCVGRAGAGALGGRLAVVGAAAAASALLLGSLGHGECRRVVWGGVVWCGVVWCRCGIRDGCGLNHQGSASPDSMHHSHRTTANIFFGRAENGNPEPRQCDKISEATPLAKTAGGCWGALGFSGSDRVMASSGDPLSHSLGSQLSALSSQLKPNQTKPKPNTRIRVVASMQRREWRTARLT